MDNKSTFNPILSMDEATVVAEFKPVKSNDNSYQSEAQLEKKFIDQLVSQGYEYIDLSKIDKNEHEQWLINNLRKQLETLNKEALNNKPFSDNEWNELFNKYICNNNDINIESKTEKIQKDDKYTITLDNNQVVNIKLIDKKNIHNNKLQVINQYVNIGGEYENRYDVNILVNGLPLVHIELKRRGIPLSEAFNQINRYKRTSFSTASKLFDYIQIFVISNGTDTKYYSNTTRYNTIRELNDKQVKSKTSNSFSFTNYWSDQKNNIICDLEDFTKYFFAKHTILNILTKYCIFTVDKRLIVMRPYQIVAVEKILERIIISNNYKDRIGSVSGGGFIWHTTGSGKTITSFKTAQIAMDLDFIDKVMFIVDRKDLDYQTMKEYENFQEGAAVSSKSKQDLQRCLENENKIIITTIQKLSNFIASNPKHEIYNKRVLMIFDECHRSQFGEMHHRITEHFKKYNIFGFTGTPIFACNAKLSLGIKPKELIKNYKERNIDKTTEQLFGDCLHQYTIVNAIKDKNVLPFRFKELLNFTLKDGVKDEQIYDIDRERVWLSPQRISMVTKYIIDNFNQQTHSHKTYEFNSLQNINEVSRDKKGDKVKQIKKTVDLRGFNSIFAVSSVEAAKKYYAEFKKQLSERTDISLKIATIYSYCPNEAEKDYDEEIIVDENNESVEGLDLDSRQFLDKAIEDYNEMFKTRFSTNGEEFQNYYRDVSLRMKNKEIDILIVVNMFLTGFDATTLNTLWVDKRLRMHGLIQAFSRTNRILNSQKQYGNIISFRNLTDELNNSLKTYSNNESGLIILKSFDDYYNGYESENGYIEGYKNLVEALLMQFPESSSIDLEKDKISFIKLFSKILKARNILYCFEEFSADKYIFTERQFQNYLGKYQDIYETLKTKERGSKKDIVDDLVFELELVKQADINLDYIWQQCVDQINNVRGDKVIEIITMLINSSYELRSKKELIQSFIETQFDIHTQLKHMGLETIYESFSDYKQERYAKEIEELIAKYNLKPEETKAFMKDCFEYDEVKEYGTDLDKIMKPMSRFDKASNRTKKMTETIDAIKQFFNKYRNI